jgi:hypothetical protein
VTDCLQAFDNLFVAVGRTNVRFFIRCVIQLDSSSHVDEILVRILFMDLVLFFRVEEIVDIRKECPPPFAHPTCLN